MSSRPPSTGPLRSQSSLGPTDHGHGNSELTLLEKQKILQIKAACGTRDLQALIQLSTGKHGLINDELRREAWPILLGCDSSQELDEPAWTELPVNQDEDQVALDVNRAFVYYPKHDTEKQLHMRKQELSNIIVEVLRRHPVLRYFQGYHDIVQVFLLVLGTQISPAAVAHLSLLRIRDFMLSTFDAAVAQLNLIHPILSSADPVLYDHLPKGQASFALAGTITMFAHNIQEYKDITRLFDFFLAHHAVVPIYFFAAVVLSRHDEMLDIEAEDTDIMHAMLGKLPQPFDLEYHIARAVELYEDMPPDTLQGWSWWHISSASVLKTSCTPEKLAKTTLTDAEILMQKQELAVRRRQLLRGTISYVRMLDRRLLLSRRYKTYGVALLVGIYALWLARSSDPIFPFTVLKPFRNLVGRLSGVMRT